MKTFGINLTAKQALFVLSSLEGYGKKLLDEAKNNPIDDDLMIEIGYNQQSILNLKNFLMKNCYFIF